MSKSGRPLRQGGMATLSIIAALGWQLLALLLILLRPDLHPSWQTISEWAIGPFGWLMQLGFLLSATSGFDPGAGGDRRAGDGSGATDLVNL